MKYVSAVENCFSSISILPSRKVALGTKVNKLMFLAYASKREAQDSRTYYAAFVHCSATLSMYS